MTYSGRVGLPPRPRASEAQRFPPRSPFVPVCPGLGVPLDSCRCCRFSLPLPKGRRAHDLLARLTGLMRSLPYPTESAAPARPAPNRKSTQVSAFFRLSLLSPCTQHILCNAITQSASIERWRIAEACTFEPVCLCLCLCLSVSISVCLLAVGQDPASLTRRALRPSLVVEGKGIGVIGLIFSPSVGEGGSGRFAQRPGITSTFM